MKLSESIDILRRKQAEAQLQLDGGRTGGQYEGIVKAIDEVCDDINLLVVNEFIPFVTETRVYLPEAIDILETEKQNTIFAILTTEDDQIGTDKIPSMQKFVLAVDIALYLMKRYGNIFCDFDINKCCTPKYLGENTAIGCRDGQCNCGNIVRSYQDYCDACGIRLCWDNVHA